MRIAGLIGVLLMLATSSAAQDWTAKIARDDVYHSSVLSLAGAAHLSCYARAPENAPIVASQWHTVNVGQPWHYLFEAMQALVPVEPTVLEVEMILFVDGTGYRLPPVVRNELEGTWQVILPMGDPMVTALKSARRLVLQVGTAHAWELPVAGLATGLKEIQDACISSWNAIGLPTPPGVGGTPSAPARPAAAPAQAGFALPASLQAYANQQCRGSAGFPQGALKAGDLDADGAPDVVMDWGTITCNGQRLRNFCGAANCQFDVFLSSRGYALSDTRLATRLEIVTHRSGRMGLGMGGTASVCGQIDCSVPWLWNGTAFVQVP